MTPRSRMVSIDDGYGEGMTQVNAMPDEVEQLSDARPVYLRQAERAE